jgi:2,3-bisphosphoglycerate-independent phosphoglycerate mutase
MNLPEGAGSVPVPAVALVILDGWGLAPPGPGNAIEQADTPVFDALWARYPHTQLSATGTDVGLPEGQMGNSEVGHLNLGAGAVVKQDLARIDDAVADRSFFDNEALRGACAAARDGSGGLHLMGLVSDGGVHSGWEHIRALVELASREGVPDPIVHVFTDGRDTLPTAGAGYVEALQGWLAEFGGRIGTVSGRYWGMDRDNRWERTERAYDAIVKAEGTAASDPVAAVRASYDADVTDEFVEPVVIEGYRGLEPGDAAIHFNFRPDRARQLVRALAEDGFGEFDRGEPPAPGITTLTQYREGWPYPVAFPPKAPAATLAEVLSEAGARQLHVAETEKYAHVTYFFNGGHEAEWAGEERRLVESPRDVPTYDHKPEMSAAAAAETFCEHWRADGFRFGIINFANPDMVGHTGSIPAAVAAVEAVDGRLGEVVAAVHESGGACVITADHGNADNMLEPDGSPNTAHSTNPVPLIVTVEGAELPREGILADVAPTVLELLGIEAPAEMTGRSLLG